MIAIIHKRNGFGGRRLDSDRNGRKEEADTSARVTGGWGGGVYNDKDKKEEYFTIRESDALGT